MCVIVYFIVSYGCSINILWLNSKYIHGSYTIRVL